MARTLRHELCHALDREEGLAEALAGELDPDSVDASAYPTEAGRLAEAFALACEGGPPPLQMRAALETRCGLDANPAAAPVRAEVYPFAPGELPVEVGEDAQGEHVLALLEGGELWQDGERAPGLEGAETLARGPDGAVLIVWYVEGLTGSAVGAGASWTIHTSCDGELSGAAHVWWSGEPLVAAQLGEAALRGLVRGRALSPSPQPSASSRDNGSTQKPRATASAQRSRRTSRPRTPAPRSVW